MSLNFSNDSSSDNEEWEVTSNHWESDNFTEVTEVEQLRNEVEMLKQERITIIEKEREDRKNIISRLTKLEEYVQGEIAKKKITTEIEILKDDILDMEISRLHYTQIQGEIQREIQGEEKNLMLTQSMFEMNEKDLVNLLRSSHFTELHFQNYRVSPNKMEIAIYNLPSLTKISGCLSFEFLQGFCQRCPELTELDVDCGDIQSTEWLHFYCSNLKRLTIKGNILSFTESKWINFTYGCRNLTHLDISQLKLYIHSSNSSNSSNRYANKQEIASLLRGAIKLKEIVSPFGKRIMNSTV